MRESKKQIAKYCKVKRFSLAHEVIDTREILVSQLGNSDLIEEYYQGMLQAIKALKKLEKQLGGKV